MRLILQNPKLKKGLDAGDEGIGIFDVPSVQHFEEHHFADFVHLDVFATVGFGPMVLDAIFS